MPRRSLRHPPPTAPLPPAAWPATKDHPRCCALSGHGISDGFGSRAGRPPLRCEKRAIFRLLSIPSTYPRAAAEHETTSGGGKTSRIAERQARAAWKWSSSPRTYIARRRRCTRRRQHSRFVTSNCSPRSVPSACGVEAARVSARIKTRPVAARIDVPNDQLNRRLVLRVTTSTRSAPSLASPRHVGPVRRVF